MNKHEWDATGERCVKCGAKDWMGDECSSSASPACSITLPQITDELVDLFYPWLIADDGGGYTWNQAAVDFTCALKGECNRRSGKQ